MFVSVPENDPPSLLNRRNIISCIDVTITIKCDSNSEKTLREYTDEPVDDETNDPRHRSLRAEPEESPTLAVRRDR